IGRRAAVVIGGTGRIHARLHGRQRLTHLLPEHALSRGAAANIPMANHQNRRHFQWIHWINRPSDGHNNRLPMYFESCVSGAQSTHKGLRKNSDLKISSFVLRLLLAVALGLLLGMLEQWLVEQG